MKRWKIFIGVSLLVLAGVIGGGYWIITTTPGAHFFLRVVSFFAPFHMEAREIKGTLAAPSLSVKDLKIRWAGGEMTLASLDLVWQPREIWRRNLLLEKVSAKGILIRDQRPATRKPPELLWPIFPWMTWMNGRAEAFLAEDVSYHRQNGEPITISRISCLLSLNQATLEVRDLQVLSSLGRAEGKGILSFAHPELRVDLKVFFAKKYANLDSFSLILALAPGKKPAQAAGPLLILGSEGRSEIMRLEGTIALARDAIQFQDLKLNQLERKGVVKGNGELVFSKETRLAFQVSFTDLDLQREIGRNTALSGQMYIQGNPTRYQGSFRVLNREEGWESVSLSGKLQGTEKGVEFKDLRGEWLKGEVSGVAAVIWGDPIWARASLRGRNLNPAGFAAEKIGKISMDLEGKLQIPGKDFPSGDAQIRFQEGGTEGQGSKGFLKVRLKENGTHTASFSFNLPRGEVRASLSGSYREGVLEEVIQTLEGRDPSGAWVMEAPTRVQISSREVKIFPLHLASSRKEKVMLTADFLLNPLRGTLEASWRQINLARANQLFEKDKLQGHTSGQVTARWQREKGWKFAGTANLEGIFTEDSLVVQVPFSLLKIVWDDRGLESTLDMRIAGNGKIYAKASSSEPARLGFPEKGRAEITWQGIDLELLRPLFPAAVGLKGKGFGRLQGEWLPGSRAKAEGEARVSQTQVTYQRGKVLRVDIDKGGLTFSYDRERLSGKLEMTLREHGFLKGAYSLPLSFQPSFRILPAQPAEIALQGRIADKGLLAAFFPDVVQTSRGTMDVDFLARGSREKPILKGTLEVREADVGFYVNSKNEPREGEPKKNSQSMNLAIHSGRASIDWNETGLAGDLNLNLQEGGRLQGKISSQRAEPFTLPKQGQYAFAWEKVEPIFLRPLFPSSLRVTGEVSGQIEGQWLPEWRWQATGSSRISKGLVRWQSKGGMVQSAIEKAEVSFSWREEALRGSFSFSLADNGWGRGNFLLPVLPCYPMAIRPSGALEISLTGMVQDRDLLATVAPEVIQSSRGKMEWDLTANGIWEKPRFSGTVKIGEAEIQIHAGQNRGQKNEGMSYSGKGILLAIPSGVLKAEWSERGLRAELDFEVGDGGKIQARISSRETARMEIPQQGEMEAAWKSIQAGLLASLLPETLSLQGSAKGRARLQWFSGSRLDVSGEVEISSGAAAWRGNGGKVQVNIAEAKAEFFWKDENLRGDFSLNLSQQGFLKGRFQVPLFARFPAVMQGSGPIRISLQGQIQEKGLIPAMLPGLLRESRGEMKVDLQISGTWGNPLFEGDLSLAKGGGYLPTLGVTLEDLTVRMRLKDERIQVETVQIKSGPGQIKGTAMLWLKDWQISRYEGSLEGENFQTVRLPELQILASPRLTFRGTAKEIAVRGDIHLPEFLIYGKGRNPVVSSSDVILMDEKPQPKSEFELDIKVRLILGKRALAKIAGVDAQLEGAVEAEILGREKEKITARGEIRVKEEGGSYTAYGLQLKIVKGRLIFAGPLDRPSLDITALRQIRDAQAGIDVQAGVRVIGDLQRPQIILYSQPPMAETDILSYMVLGRPFNQKSGDLALLGSAAGALIRQLESVTLQDKMKRYISLDTMDVQSSGGDIRSSMVTIGKYMNPNLYLSLGKSVFSDSALLSLRYEFSKAQKWEIAARSGDQSGFYLYYRVEFE